MQDAHALTVPESEEEWRDFIRGFEEDGDDVHVYLRDRLEQEKGRLLKVLPKEFHPFIEDGSINQPYLPKSVQEKLLIYLHEMEQNYREVFEQAHDHFESICDQIPKNFVTLKDARLHDSRILHIARKDDEIRLTIDSSGSFNNASCIVVTFKKVKEESSELPLMEAQWWLYEEVDIHDEGTVFSLLLDCPMTRWMVVAEDVIIEYYYKANSLPVWQDEESTLGATEEALSKREQGLQVKFPTAYRQLLAEQNGGQLTHSLIVATEKVVEIGPLFGANQLVREGDFVWLNHNVALQFHEDSEPVVVHRDIGQLAESFEQFLERCLSATYTDEYAVFSIPLAEEELESALLGEDLERMVRAWNTMNERPEKYVPLIEKGILFLLNQEDSNLYSMGSTNAFIFDNKGVLTAAFKEKLKEYED